MESKDLFTNFNRIIHGANPLIIAILRSPLHSMMSKAIMLITFTGRRSGKRYTTPVSYTRDGETCVCVHAWHVVEEPAGRRSGIPAAVWAG